MVRRFGYRFLITALVLGPLLAHAWGLVPLGFLTAMESFAYDLRLTLTMPHTRDERVVIVDLDERSLSQVGQWPWPRDRVAQLIDQLFAHYNARVVGFDIVFAEPDSFGGLSTLEALAVGELRDNQPFLAQMPRLREELDYDAKFSDAVQGRNVVMGYVFQRCPSSAPAGMLPASVADAAGLNIDFFSPCAFTANIPQLQRAAAAGGFFDNPALDRDGAFRRVPLVQRYGGVLYESFALAVTRAAIGLPRLEFAFFSGPEGPRDGLDLEWLQLGSLRLPVDEHASVLVPYRGRQGAFPYVPALDVLEGTAPLYPLQGAIVLIGSSAAGLRDLKVTPVGEAFPGVEVHANIITGILDQRIMHSPPYLKGIEVSVLVILALLMTAVMQQGKLARAALFTVFLLVSAITLNMQLWVRTGVVVPLASPLLLIGTLFFAQLIFNYMGEIRAKGLLSSLFGQYVPPELVAEMARDPRRVSPQVDSREMTVMFTDIRGFTGISETLAPRELSRLMNEFLTPMTRVIHRSRGTIDKYIGDSIMAFWGAPLPDEEHAHQALVAAMEMVGVMRDLRPHFIDRGWPPLEIGIGLNTGLMRVGNMGSQFRQAYTVMGDAVNLGSRLEGLTKEYGVSMAVGQSTVAAAPKFAFLELDRVRVKGKDEPVAVFEPLGRTEELAAQIHEMISAHHRALHAYRERDWDRAEQAFFALRQAHPERRIFGLYLERIANHRSAPPAEAWDGIASFAAK